MNLMLDQLPSSSSFTCLIVLPKACIMFYFNNGCCRLLFFLSHIFINFIGFTNSQPDFLAYFCPTNTTTYTTNSKYEANLNTLLSSLTSNIDSYGFLNTSVGSNSDLVNAIVMCRGDIELDICRSCVNDSTKKLVQVCPNYKEAIGWYDHCMLRYSNRSIFGSLETQPFFFRWTVNVSGMIEYDRASLNLLSILLLSKKPWTGDSRRKFSTGSVDTMIYGLWQCTPDLSLKQCYQCLRFVDDLSKVPLDSIRSRGGRIVSPSCVFRFDYEPFFSSLHLLPPSPSLSLSPLPSPPGRKRRKRMLIIICTSVSGVLTLTLLAFCLHCMMRIKRREREDKKKVQLLDLAGDRIADDYSIKDLHGKKQSKSQDCPLIRFDLIEAATQHFSEDNKLGQGGFGPVYKGTLANGKEIAVKRLSRTSGQGLVEFKNEVKLIARLQHRNLVRLLGWCLERNESLLIYEFMPNKSLDVFLFDSLKGVQLDWKKRLNIVKGIARGLLYLHEDSRLKIIHRDLKSGNVLLDHEMNPKISDFGLARIFAGNQIEANTNRVAGTYGYMAPEYAMEGQFSIKSDVFSFGVLLLEIVSGKKNNGSSLSQIGESLPTFAWKLWCEGKGLELMDPLIVESSVPVEVLKCIHIGLLCVQENPGDRLTMSTVVVALGGDGNKLPLPTPPPFCIRRTGVKSIQIPANDQVCSANEVTHTDLSPR